MSQPEVMGSSGSGPPWWHGAVLYQLYVRSWRDANDDGYGDLRGIIERLDHLSWLGVDGVLALAHDAVSGRRLGL